MMYRVSMCQCQLPSSTILVGMQDYDQTRDQTNTILIVFSLTISCDSKSKYKVYNTVWILILNVDH